MFVTPLRQELVGPTAAPELSAFPTLGFPRGVGDFPGLGTAPDTEKAH